MGFSFRRQIREKKRKTDGRTNNSMVAGYGPSVFGNDMEKDSLGNRGASMLWEGGKNAAALAAAAWGKGGEAAAWTRKGFGYLASGAGKGFGNMASGTRKRFGNMASGTGNFFGAAYDRIRKDAARSYDENKKRVAQAVTKGVWDKENRELMMQVEKMQKGSLADTGLEKYYGFTGIKPFEKDADKQREHDIKIEEMQAEETRQRREEGDEDMSWYVPTKLSENNIGEPYKHHYVIGYTFT